jgi:F-type H+-transporting ATPase subunit delta
MPLTRGTARRYAEAAFEIAERDGSMDAWLAALSVVDERLVSADVLHLLSNPALPSSKRIAVLERILDGDIVGAPRNLVALMVQRGRVELLPTVLREFRRLYARREGIVEATVTSAVPLSEADQKALQERLVELTGKRVDVTPVVDEQLLGGMQVRIGDELIDGSVRGRLERLRTTFTTSAI